jgi:hypothetical protein
VSAELTRAISALTEMLAIEFLDRQTKCGAKAYCTEPATIVWQGFYNRIHSCDKHIELLEKFASDDKPLRLPNVDRVRALLKGAKWGQ